MIFKIKEELYSGVPKEDIQRIKYFLENHTLEKLTIEGNEWEIIDTGSGTEIVLIFSGGLRKSYLSSFPFIDTLEEDYRIIAPSHPRLNTIREFLEGIEEILKVKRLDQLYVMGNSFGGVVAQCYADLYPHRVKKLVLINTLSGTTALLTKFFRLSCRINSILPPKTALNFYKKQLLTILSIPKSNKEFWKAFLDDAFFGEYTYEDYVSLQKNQLDYMENYSNLPDPYKGEVIIINSKDDISTIKTLKKKLYERYPHASEYKFEIGGHLPSLSRPPEFKKVIDSFLR